MTRREQAKEANRARVRAAAEAIIRTEGMDKLTMRHLAERASVSLRTPYNLFGSKTDVLIALLEDAGFDLPPAPAVSDDSLIVELLLGALDQAEQFFGTDEMFYREVFGGIMSSEHHQARQTGVERVVALCRDMMGQAAAHGELQRDTDTELLGSDLALQLLAVLGMWGSGFFTSREGMRQVRRSWCAVLLNHCGDASRPTLEAAYQAALLPGR